MCVWYDRGGIDLNINQKLIDEILSSALSDERKLDLVYFYVSGMNSEEFTRAVIKGAL